jgi:hypothetical protein
VNGNLVEDPRYKHRQTAVHSFKALQYSVYPLHIRPIGILAWNDKARNTRHPPSHNKHHLHPYTGFSSERNVDANERPETVTVLHDAPVVDDNTQGLLAQINSHPHPLAPYEDFRLLSIPKYAVSDFSRPRS